jgi:chromosome segregation ATPase
MNRIRQTNQKLYAKEIKIIQLREENKQLKEKIEELYNIKDSNNLNNIDLKIKEENINLSKKLDEQKQTNEKLKEELKIISNEHNIYRKRLLSLGIQFIGEHEFKIPKDQAFERLNDEIEQLKGENETLKDMIETLKKDFLGNNKKKKEENEMYDDEILKNQYDELEGFKQKKYKYINEQGNNGDEINSLKKENEKLTKQIMKFSKEYTELQKQYDELENKYKISSNNENKIPISNSNNSTTTNEEIVNELKKIKNENEQIKKKNMELISQLEEKEIKYNYYNKSDDENKSNYEEEFDLKKMVKGVKEKNRSQDINIDYPGMQSIKEKYRELNFYYNSLETLVKQLLLNVQVGPKNKTYVTELCKLVGFDLETTNKILNNKNSKKILGLFQK